MEGMANAAEAANGMGHMSVTYTHIYKHVHVEVVREPRVHMDDIVCVFLCNCMLAHACA